MLTHWLEADEERRKYVFIKDNLGKDKPQPILMANHSKLLMEC